MRFVVSLFLCVAAFAAGCASPMGAWDIALGTPRADVVARAGQPTRLVALPNGLQRLQYSMQPLGHHVFMVDVDAAGRVVRSRQVMTPEEFQRIEPGKWLRADVEREFGPPAQVDAVTSFRGTVMTYRWKQGNDPMFYWVYVDPAGVVQRAHPGMEFVNAPNDRS
ncbi:hypothetical protein [Ramlibacter sp.]|uniref:hypothetical protein n=1 Tax=Ramlibacter sp. TaxID=1917967 RepID=UPI003D109790